MKIDGLETDEAVFMEVKAGQFFIFNERTMHGSDANKSDTDRTGVAVRIVANSTRVYAGQKVDGQGMHLKNWHAILIHGEDRLDSNKIGPPPDRDDYKCGLVKTTMGKIRYLWQRQMYGYRY